MSSERRQPQAPPDPQPRQVIYAGPDSALIAAALAPLGHSITLRCEAEISAVLVAAAQARVHAVIVDLTVPDDARTLLVAALANSRHPPRIVLLARRDRLSALLRLPGVYSVVAYPLLPAQIRAAVSDRRAKRRPNSTPQEPPAEAVEAAAPPAAAEPAPTAPAPARDFKAPEVAKAQAAWPGFRLYMLGANRFMSLVSTLYKNMAFLLLACLFTAFCFYGFLIGYFLLASSWGAPVTLSRGHQLVEKAVTEIADLRAALSTNTQRAKEAELEAGKARSSYADARVLVDYMNGTISSEIAARGKQIVIAKRAAARAEKVLKDFTGASVQRQQTGPQELFRKRLITRQTFDAQLLGSLELSQRAATLATAADAAEAEVDRLAASVAYLTGLRAQLAGEVNAKPAPGSADLILLTKEAVDARSSLDQAATQMASAEDRLKLLAANGAQLQQRIAEIEQSAVGRAANARVDVVFVPYGNERSFAPGTALYTCRLTVVFCHRAGTVGAVLPGESTAVHPFFGKPMRGFFVEAKLADANAASEEIIHAGRPPFFF